MLWASGTWGTATLTIYQPGFRYLSICHVFKSSESKQMKVDISYFLRRGFDSHFGSWQLVTNYYTRMTESALVSNPDKVAPAIVGVKYFYRLTIFSGGLRLAPE